MTINIVINVDEQFLKRALVAVSNSSYEARRFIYRTPRPSWIGDWLDAIDALARYTHHKLLELEKEEAKSDSMDTGNNTGGGR